MEFLQEELDEILNIFQQEGAEILQSMDKNLLLLEKKPNNLDVAMHLFRDAHSLKGSARMLGFNGIQNIAHKIEDVLGLIREGKLEVNSNVTDTISAALSCIDNLIKKTVEQKSEFISEESDFHIKKLTALCENTSQIDVDSPLIEKQEKKGDDPFVNNFSKFEDLITGIVFIYSKCVHDNDFEQFGDILNIITELSHLCENTGNGDLYNIALAMSDYASESIRADNKNEDILYELNLKINDFIQQFNLVARSKNLNTGNYYENAYKISADNKLHDTEAKENIEEDELKSAELLELINKATETIPKISQNRHSLAEAKSLLNEIVSRLINDDFKKIYQTVLAIILNYEKSASKLENDATDALKEILESTAGIVEAKFSKNVYNDFAEEIELLNQKALIVAQMIKYELQNPNKNVRQKSFKPVDWAQSFDSTAIKTLRVNSDKLDKLVNQIGNLIVTRIKSHEHVGMVKAIQDELIEWQKHYHKIGYYMKFYEKKYIQDSIESDFQGQKKDSFLGYNRQLVAFHNSNTEKMNFILSNLSSLMKELQENNLKLNSTTAEIENMVKSMRILPLSTVFNLFPRMVHNIAKDKGKEIELTIEGQDVSADKKIIEDIKIPIMHIVRNSLDHGIESPRERERLGKSKTGNISIRALQRENKIVISIKDDGKGINIEKIKQKAIEKGFVSQEAAETMSKEQLANFIFYPGFSTGDTVTELSGRGLGLDIVHTKVSQMNGRIDVYSEENKGTVVTMELPTTMATLRAFIIMENNQLFAIPANSIQTVLRISPSEIKNRDKKVYFIYDGEIIPVSSLSSILGNREKETPADKLTIMVIKSESITTGIIVEKLVGDEEILHKKLPEPMLRVKNISGITTLANGEMCLLLNVSDILSSSRVNINELNVTKSLTLQDNSKYKILIVDDSITTRRLLKNIMSSSGYKPDIVASAKEGLRLLDTQNYDLIVSDYEMSEINGLEFIEIVRNKERTKNIPVIVITSIERAGLKEDFMKLNVQEFIKKEYFEQQSFIRTINKYLDISINAGMKN